MARTVTDIDEDALAWTVRVGDRAFDDWDAFTAWLEADPRHAAAYDTIAAAVGEAAAAATSAPVPSATVPHRSRRVARRWLGGGMAAALAVAVAVPLWNGRPQPFVVETAAAATRTVRLADGSAVILGNATRVTLDHGDPRRASLDRGEAMFVVRHDGAHPFEVRVGETGMVDLGTRFTVKRAPGLVRVAVAEGAVLYDPDGARVRLDPGDALADDGGTVRRERVDPGSVGEWRHGVLSYDGARLDEVASDLERLLGRRVTVAPGLEARVVRATLATVPIRRDPALLGALLGVRVVQVGGGWRLEPAR